MYSAYFGFRSLPFHGRPSPAPIYHSSAFRKAHRALYEGARRGERLMVLTGMPGVGKTTLLHKIQASLQSNGFAVFASEHGGEPEELIEACRASLEVDTQRPREMAFGEAPHERIAIGRRSGPGAVIIIDDADSLPDAALQSLLELFAPGDAGAARMAAIVAGGPGFEQRMTDLGLPVRGPGAGLCCSLAPLARQELRGYLHTKLDAVGYEGPELFSDDALHALAQHGCGIPKRIETLCGMALLVAFDAGRRIVDGASLAEAVDDFEGLVGEATPLRDHEDSVREATPPADHEGLLGETSPLPDHEGLDLQTEDAERGPRRPNAFEMARMLARRLAIEFRPRLAQVNYAVARAERAARSAWRSVWRRLVRGCRHGAGRLYARIRAQHAVLETARTLVDRLSRAIGPGLAVLAPIAALAGRTMRDAWHAVRGIVMHGLRRAASWRYARNRARSRATTEISLPLNPEPERDWLALKIGFVGVLVLGLFGVLFMIMYALSVNTPTRAGSPPPQAGYPGDNQESSGAVLRQQDEGQLAMLQEKYSRLEESLEQVRKELSLKEELIGKQQASIEQLREQTEVREARMTAASKSPVPASEVLPSSVSSISTPEGGAFGFSPVEGSGNGAHRAMVQGKVRPDTARQLRKLAGGGEAVDAGVDATVGAKASGGDDVHELPTSTEDGGRERRTEPLVIRADEPGSNDRGVGVSLLEPMPPQEVAAQTKASGADRTLPRAALGAEPPEHPIVEAAKDPEPGMASVSPAVSAGHSVAEPTEALTTESPEESARRRPTAVVDPPSAESAAHPREAKLPPVEERLVGVPAAEARSHPGPGARSVSTVDGGKNLYKVVAGDTLSAISRRFGVKVAELREWNGLTTDRLSIGQSLRVAPVDALVSELSGKLLAAAREGEFEQVEKLLDAGASLDGRDAEGKTALMYAAARGHLAVVKLLMERGTDVNLRSKSGDTALSFAAWHGRFSILSALLRGGAKADVANNEGQTALMFASINGHERCVRRLLEEGANVNARSNDLRTALSAAVWNGHARIARALLDRGAKVNERMRDGWTVLMDAAWNGRADLVDLLLEYGADPKAKTDTGLTPAAAAKQQGYGDIAAAISRSLGDAS